MGCYLILSEPIEKNAPPNYKGLYRSQPFPSANPSAEFLSLWERYVEHYESPQHMGITTELSLSELDRLATLAMEGTGNHFEVIYISQTKTCPHNAVYYGIDVTGVGGYSILGEGLFREAPLQVKNMRKMLRALNRFFQVQLNAYRLFDSQEHAQFFLDTLNHLNQENPGCIEPEDWCLVHIYSLSKCLNH